MNTFFDKRYELIKIEAKTDYYYDILHNYYETALSKSNRQGSGDTLWKHTKDLLEVSLAKLLLVKKSIEEAMDSHSYFALQSSLSELMKLRALTSEKPSFPHVKKAINIAISDIELSIADFMKKP